MILFNPSRISSGPQIAQTGIFEKYILCKDCEANFSKYERYLSHIFKGSEKSPIRTENRNSHDGLKTVYLKGLDYYKFMYCFLSIVWRAHISTNKFFININLSDFSDLIKADLIAKPEEFTLNYRLTIVSILNKDDKLIKLISNPFLLKLDKGLAAVFYINGFVYFFEILRIESIYLFEVASLKRTGEIEIALLKGKAALTILEKTGLDKSVAANLLQVDGD